MLIRLKNSWMFYAFATFILFGMTNFILGYIGKLSGKNVNSSISSIMLLWAGMGALGVIVPAFLKSAKGDIPGKKSRNFTIFGILAGITLTLYPKI